MNLKEPYGFIRRDLYQQYTICSALNEPEKYYVCKRFITYNYFVDNYRLEHREPGNEDVLPKLSRNIFMTNYKKQWAIIHTYYTAVPGCLVLNR